MGVGSNKWCSAYPAHSAFVSSLSRGELAQAKDIRVVQGDLWAMVLADSARLGS